MKIPTPLRAIRLKCLDCSAGSAQEVRECNFTDCPLYYYRSGHNPKRKGVGDKNIKKTVSSQKSAIEPKAVSK